jgi:hypothetical protein
MSYWQEPGIRDGRTEKSQKVRKRRRAFFLSGASAHSIAAARFIATEMPFSSS